MIAFFRMIPSSVWIGLAAAIALLAGVWTVDHHGYERGMREKQAELDAYKVEMAQALQKEKARQATVVEKVVVEYRDRIKIVKEKGDEIIQAVPLLVHGACQLDGGFRVLHDAAASGVFPEDPGRAVDSAPAVDELTVAQTVAANYQTCRETAARLTALQQLVTQLGAP